MSEQCRPARAGTPENTPFETTAVSRRLVKMKISFFCNAQASRDCPGVSESTKQFPRGPAHAQEAELIGPCLRYVVRVAPRKQVPAEEARSRILSSTAPSTEVAGPCTAASPGVLRISFSGSPLGSGC